MCRNLPISLDTYLVRDMFYGPQATVILLTRLEATVTVLDGPVPARPANRPPFAVPICPFGAGPLPVCVAGRERPLWTRSISNVVLDRVRSASTSLQDAFLELLGTIRDLWTECRKSSRLGSDPPPDKVRERDRLWSIAHMTARGHFS